MPRGSKSIENCKGHRTNAEKEARQQEFENWVKRQQLANDTAQTNYNTNKPYYKSNSSNNSDDNTFLMNLSQVTDDLNQLESAEEQKERIFELEQAGYINSAQANQLFSYYQL